MEIKKLENSINGERIREQVRNTKQDVDIASILIDIGWIKAKISNIEDNHLVCINNRLEKIEEKLNERPTWLMTGIISLCLALLMFIISYIFLH
jgi:hypothetical protein